MSEFCLVQIMAPNEEWFRVLPNANQLATDVIQRAVRESGKVHSNSEVSVVFSDDRELHLLNKEYRGIDKPTNVLSFPGPELEPEDPNTYTVRDRPHVLGDIVLSLETTQREANEQSKELKHHVAHLLVHGALHLLRYDHENDADAEVMENLERKVLAGLGIGDPYELPADQETDDAQEMPAAEAPAPVAEAEPAPKREPAPKKAAPKRAARKPAAVTPKRVGAKTVAPKAAAKKRATKPKAAAARKATTRKPERSTKRAKRTASQRPTPKRAAPKRAAPKRAAAKRPVPKRAAPKRPVAKRAAPKRTAKRSVAKRPAPRRSGARRR